MKLIMSYGDGECRHYYSFEHDSVEAAREELDSWQKYYRSECAKIHRAKNQIDMFLENCDRQLFGIKIVDGFKQYTIAYNNVDIQTLDEFFEFNSAKEWWS